MKSEDLKKEERELLDSPSTVFVPGRDELGPIDTSSSHTPPARMLPPRMLQTHHTGLRIIITIFGLLDT